MEATNSTETQTGENYTAFFPSIQIWYRAYIKTMITFNIPK